MSDFDQPKQPDVPSSPSDSTTGVQKKYRLKLPNSAPPGYVSIIDVINTIGEDMFPLTWELSPFYKKLPFRYIKSRKIFRRYVMGRSNDKTKVITYDEADAKILKETGRRYANVTARVKEWLENEKLQAAYIGKDGNMVQMTGIGLWSKYRIPIFYTGMVRAFEDDVWSVVYVQEHSLMKSMANTNREGSGKKLLIKDCANILLDDAVASQYKPNLTSFVSLLDKVFGVGKIGQSETAVKKIWRKAFSESSLAGTEGGHPTKRDKELFSDHLEKLAQAYLGSETTKDGRNQSSN